MVKSYTQVFRLCVLAFVCYISNVANLRLDKYFKQQLYRCCRESSLKQHDVCGIVNSVPLPNMKRCSQSITVHFTEAHHNFEHVRAITLSCFHKIPAYLYFTKCIAANIDLSKYLSCCKRCSYKPAVNISWKRLLYFFNNK